MRRPLELPHVHDFAVIWDEDHDERIIEAVERIYMAGLLSPIQFIGERKDVLTAIVAAKFYFSGSEEDTETYRRALEKITQELDDPWPTEIGSFDRQAAPDNVGAAHRRLRYKGRRAGRPGPSKNTFGSALSWHA